MKTKIQLLYVICLLIPSFAASSQETRFFMPYEIKNAYDNSTRSYDGKPGEQYWQNTVDYKIEAKINITKKILEAKEEITYFNNSPDNLNMIVIRLYYDVYKKGNARASLIKTDDITNGIELSDVLIGGESYDLDDKKIVRRRGTNISFKLKNSLKSGEKIKLQLAWKQNIPKTNRRSGVYDSTTFFIGQWYPQIAVYDDLFGWDRLDYNLRTEFYNNLANFDVKITVPKEYALWATGTFENAKEVLPEDIYVKYEKAMQSEEVIHIIDSTNLKNGFRTKDSTWHFTAKEVSDFGFGLSNHFQWDAAIVKINNRSIFISSAFPDNKAEKYQEHASMQQKVMKHFSNDFPGIPYPYEAFTTFIGLYGGGMEYPMMANNDGPDTYLAIHEMFHTYFPMYVRINERRWAWMDEGWAEYGTTVVQNRYFEDKNNFESIFAAEKLFSNGTMGSVADLPLIISSQFMDDYNYGYASYPLPANVYGILHHHLGEELFMKCYHEYINRWAKKSPTPYDFFYTFENVSKQDLSWIWKPWFFEFGVPDVAIQSFKKAKLIISNKGQKPFPVFVEIMYNDSTFKTISKTANIWSKGAKTIEINIPNYKAVSQISVNKKVSDFNNLDNFYPSIQDRYKKLNISDNILGEYLLPQFKVNLKITKKNGVIYFVISDWQVNDVVYPKSTSVLKTLDDSISLVFQFDESGNCSGIKIDWDGWKVDAEKL